MENRPNFRVGDKVRIIDYGSEYWVNKEEYRKSIFAITIDGAKRDHDFWFGGKGGEFNSANVAIPKKPRNVVIEYDDIWICDMNPEIVGKEGVISEVSIATGVPRYAIEGIPAKHAWYNEKQMELIRKK